MDLKACGIRKSLFSKINIKLVFYINISVFISVLLFISVFNILLVSTAIKRLELYFSLGIEKKAVWK